MANESNLRIYLTIPIFFLAIAGLAQGATITVGPGDAYDFDTIQPGIDAAVDGDTVLVAPGEYVITEPITFRGKAITVKSEAGPDETTIRMGTPADTNRGSVVVFENNETAASILEGFTITGGRGSLLLPQNTWVGGGIYFDASSGTIMNCTIVQNTTDYAGGLFCGHACSPMLIDCIITENSARDSGGGLFFWDEASLILNNCTITANSAKNFGGGFSCYNNASATLTDCIVSDNSVTGATAFVAGYGGGVSCTDSSSLTLTNCTIAKNSAGFSAGGVMCYKSSAILKECVIAENSAARLGGAIFCETDSSMTITNCIISENSARQRGGGLECYLNSSLTLTNCTIWGNSADQSGGGLDSFNRCSVAVINSIVSVNTSPQGRQISLRNPAATLTIAYSNIANGQAGISVEGGSVLNWDEGNMDADPLFADPNNDDFHLKSAAGRWDPNSQTWVQDDVTSPCIDAGDPNSDWTAELWPHGERINMGAYGGTREASMSTHPEVMSLPRVAFIYGSDSEAAESFQSLLVGYGCLTTLIALDDVLATPLDSYDLVIVGDDTEDAAAWNNPQVVPAIEGSGRPIIGMGEGGYDFFGMLELSIGRPHGMHDSRNSIDVIDPNHLIFIMPYPIDVPEDRILQLYTETNEVTLYLWPVPENVKVLAGEVDQNGYYPLAFEPDRYVLWGFTEPPQKMTEVGKDLFINIVIWTANAGWEMEI